jgi:hypothetical protein
VLKNIDINFIHLYNYIKYQGELMEFEIKENKRNGPKRLIVDIPEEWHSEIKSNSKSVYCLTTLNYQKIIQELISITDKGDHIFMDLIESAKFNKGKGKLYKGVAGNLVAFACKTSFEKGYEGVVSFMAKTQLIDHYTETLGAKLFSGNRMFIDTKESQILTTKYFKDFKL